VRIVESIAFFVPNNTMNENLYELIGEEGFTRLIRTFYSQVPDDEILGPMYPADEIAAAEQRLRDFLIMRFGGPPRYLDQRGHPRLRMRHMPFPIDQKARDRWVTLMERALDQADLPAEAAQTLRLFFDDTATFLINRRETG
jgi:hemoglobin